MAKITIEIDDNKYEAIKLQNIDIEKELTEKVNVLYKRVPKTLRDFIDKVEKRKKKPSKKQLVNNENVGGESDDFIQRNETNDGNNTQNNA